MDNHEILSNETSVKTVNLNIRGQFLNNLDITDIKMWVITGDWFLPSCIMHIIKDQDDPSLTEITIPIGEDYECVLSIIESIRFGNSCIILNKKKIDLLIALAEKWSCPDVLICKYINMRDRINNKLKYIEKFINPTQCKICKIGYDVYSPRVPNECKFHPGQVHLSIHKSDSWTCCGLTVGSNYCKSGFHASTINIVELMSHSSTSDMS